MFSIAGRCCVPTVSELDDVTDRVEDGNVEGTKLDPHESIFEV